MHGNASHDSILGSDEFATQVRLQLGWQETLLRSKLPQPRCSEESRSLWKWTLNAFADDASNRTFHARSPSRLVVPTAPPGFRSCLAPTAATPIGPKRFTLIWPRPLVGFAALAQSPADEWEPR